LAELERDVSLIAGPTPSHRRAPNPGYFHRGTALTHNPAALLQRFSRGSGNAFADSSLSSIAFTPPVEYLLFRPRQTVALCVGKSNGARCGSREKQNAVKSRHGRAKVSLKKISSPMKPPVRV
jgi:hypothetical protein